MNTQTIENHQSNVVARIKAVLTEHAPDLLLAFVGAGIIEQLQAAKEEAPLLEASSTPVLEANNPLPLEVEPLSTEVHIEVQKEEIEEMVLVPVEEVPAPIEAFIKAIAEDPAPLLPLVTPQADAIPPANPPEKPVATINAAVLEKHLENAECLEVEEKYDPTNLQQAVQWCYEDVSVTTTLIAQLMMLPKTSDLTDVIQYTRYHAAILKTLRPFERDEYKRMLRVRLLARFKGAKSAD